MRWWQCVCRLSPPGRVGGEEDAQRLLRRVGIEGPLDLLAPLLRRRPGVDGDAVVALVGAGKLRFELPPQIALRVLVLREDQQAGAVPDGRRSRAQVRPDPLDEPEDAGV